MPLRNQPYFVVHNTGANGRVDPYATGRRSLPTTVHGIRYSSSPQRADIIRTYALNPAVRPASSLPPSNEDARRNVDMRRVLVAVFVILVVAIVSAFVGLNAAHAITGYIDDEVMPAMNPLEGPSTKNLSEPQSDWAQGAVPVLYQTDPQWADRPFGPCTIGSAGAAPLCLSMVYVEVTGDTETTPIDIAAFAQRSGYADSADAAPLLTDGAAELGLSAESITADESSLRGALVAGSPVIAAIHAGDFGPTTSYVVLSGIDVRGKLVVHDPASPEHSARHWAFDDILSQTSDLWTYTAAE